MSAMHTKVKKPGNGAKEVQKIKSASPAAGPAMPSADMLLGLTGINALTMTSEGWAKIAARAALLSAQLREIESVDRYANSPSISPHPMKSPVEDQRSPSPTTATTTAAALCPSPLPCRISPVRSVQ